LKLQTYKLRKQIEKLEGNLIPVSEIKEIINLQWSIISAWLFTSNYKGNKSMVGGCGPL